MRRLLLLLPLLFGCARLNVTHAIESKTWLVTAPVAVLAERVQDADGYIIGTVIKTQRDWTYDLLHGGPKTHKITIQAADGKYRLLAFVPERDTLPLVKGTYAIFVWRLAGVIPHLKCDERQAITLVCPPELHPVVQSLNDIVAPADSGLVRYLFSQKR